MKSLEEAIANADLPWKRRLLSEESFIAFLVLYYADHFSLKSGDFHKLWMKELQEEDFDIFIVIAFRGCGKSTLVTELYALWRAITGRSNFMLIISHDDTLSKGRVGNIKKAIEENEKLQKDFEITNTRSSNRAINEKWTDSELMILDCKILARTIRQKVRGLKFGAYRPDAVFLDDIDDPEFARKRENRVKLSRFFYGEVLPAVQEEGAKIFGVGNLTHKACLLKKIIESKEKVAEKGLVIKTHLVPLIEKIKTNGKVKTNITWKAKYPNFKAIEKQKAKILLEEDEGETIWKREYLLQIVDDKDKIVYRNDIHSYDSKILSGGLTIKRAGAGADLAISQKETADYVAMVGGLLVDIEGKEHILILPEGVHGRLGFMKTLEEFQIYYHKLPQGGEMWIESVQYQKATQEVLEEFLGANVQEIKVTQDKTARLKSVSHLIKSGYVLFPKVNGKYPPFIKKLIDEIVDFGIEEHDDLMDAGVYTIRNLKPKTIETLVPIVV